MSMSSIRSISLVGFLALFVLLVCYLSLFVRVDALSEQVFIPCSPLLVCGTGYFSQYVHFCWPVLRLGFWSFCSCFGRECDNKQCKSSSFSITICVKYYFSFSLVKSLHTYSFDDVYDYNSIICWSGISKSHSLLMFSYDFWWSVIIFK